MESERSDSPPSGSAPGLQGEVTTVELRNESSARGRVVNVDAFMNVRLDDVTYKDRRGKSSQLQDMFITDHRVRNFGSKGGGRKEYAKKAK
ncbi:hypothetical protein KUCAC02_010874 [Chaenocephalus aceratus]|uniref:Uncharacterized protein n=1 Tax=Chaenocephalus aceratus TaxID=36190 RepID=A0ACB9WVP0_CHAAC|nr:hypothetical protein KUCAC02_010874 [Chaenocephalus aceratus]